jgi:hypothetical protein
MGASEHVLLRDMLGRFLLGSEQALLPFGPGPADVSPPMKYLLPSLLTLGLLLGGLTVADPAEASTAYTGRMGFGMDAGSISAQTNAGAKPDYAMLWVGPWNLASGWSGTNNQLSQLRSAGVTPVIQFYYWGDDMSPSCFENGCWSSLHNVWKSQSEWHRLAQQLRTNVNNQMDGRAVVIVMETEFNKGDMQTYKPFDKALADKSIYLKNNIPNSKTVLGLGTWNTKAWSTWTQAAAANDYIGVQAMRGSTRDTLTSYLNLYEATLSGARTAQSMFNKPVFITDIALSSYPSSTYEKYQADALKKFFTGKADLKKAGVHAMLYRAWYDHPTKDTKNYYGEAERHFGVAKPSSGSWKPAAKVWVDGLKAERTTTTTSTLSAKFTPSTSVNEWWVDVKVDASKSLSRVDVRVNGGSWIQLDKTSWGSWAKSTHAPKGSAVEFRATATDGSRATSSTYTWLSSSSSTSTTSYAPKFTVQSNVNEWWVDVKVEATKVSRVDVRVNSGSWIALEKTSWGTWAKSVKAPKGSAVEFRAHDGSGNTATSSTYTWLSSSSSSSTSTSTSTPSLTAKFTPSTSVNEWWVDVKVDANKKLSSVDARVNGGSWVKLDATSWGGPQGLHRGVPRNSHRRRTCHIREVHLARLRLLRELHPPQPVERLVGRGGGEGLRARDARRRLRRRKELHTTRCHELGDMGQILPRPEGHEDPVQGHR